MPRAPAMGARVEQSGEFLPCARRARRRHLEDLADSLHRLPSAAEDLYVIVPSRNRALLLQGEFCITLRASDSSSSPCWRRIIPTSFSERAIPNGSPISVRIDRESRCSRSADSRSPPCSSTLPRLCMAQETHYRPPA